jgi:hypothetical protein
LLFQRLESFGPLEGRFTPSTDAVFALLPGDAPQPSGWWKPVARLCRPRLLRLRAIELTDAVLYQNVRKLEFRLESDKLERCPD